MLYDSVNVYVAKLEVYIRKENNRSEHGLGHHVVSRLTSFIRNTFRWVFFDNLFTGLSLTEDLMANGKGFPLGLKKPRDVRETGAFKIMQKRGYKCHYINSNSFTPCPPSWTQRTCTRRMGPEVMDLHQPHSMTAYNESMTGVDLHDQLLAKYPLGRDSQDGATFFVLTLTHFFLFKQASSRPNKKRFTHLDFRQELINQAKARFSRHKRSSFENRPRVGIALENVDGHLNVRRLTCKYHALLKQRKETLYGCEICNVHLYKQGHMSYHTLPAKREYMDDIYLIEDISHDGQRHLMLTTLGKRVHGAGT
ncbi:hypothetical protein MAR_019948 [Mya arenaria]|uniref:PiggyBac transposable element-derived protein domain-containing protein n=1 Tax=Mya arenaria TaxID=6604 RepID=A0ABY7E853_MYAAR|nr:hypothetical protein MAR_019948 [Mya arenaria]